MHDIIKSLISPNMDISITDIKIINPKYDINYYIKYQQSYYYTIRVQFKYKNNIKDNIDLYIPKVENNLYYYNYNKIPKLKIIINSFLLNSPFKFEKKKNQYIFTIPKLFNININKNTIYYNKYLYNLNQIDLLNIKLPDRCWQKLNYFNENIKSNKFTYKIFKQLILPTLFEYQNNFNEIIYYDLEIKPFEKKLYDTLYNNQIIKYKINLHYKKSNKFYLTPLQNFINDFFNVYDNRDIQTISITNLMSIESQSNKVYIEKNNVKYKINYNKSFINFLCPIHTHEGQLNNIKNELSNLVDKNTFKLKLLDKHNNEVLVDYYKYFNSYLYINDFIKLYRGEYIKSNKWDYKKKHIDDVLSISSSCIPLLNSTDSVRGLLGTTMMTQAIPLIKSTPNLIYTDAEEEIFNRCSLNIYSNYEGIITELNENYIVIDNQYIIKKPDSIKSNNNTYNNYYLNQELKLNQKINKNTLIYILDSFKSNRLSLAVQARIAYMNYYGYTFEDGIVISESFSKKLGHLQKEKLEYKLNNIKNIDYICKINDKKNKNSLLLSYVVTDFNNKLHKIKKLFDMSQPELISIYLPAHISNCKIINTEIIYKDTIDNELKMQFNSNKKDTTITHNYIIYITVEYINYAKLGDKLTNRYGSKGVITKIVEDNLMIKDKDNNIIDIIMSPNSIVSRKNISQVYEVMLGNILTELYILKLPYNHKIYDMLYNDNEKDYYHDFAKKYKYYCLKINALNDINCIDLIKKLNNILNIKSYIKLYDPIAKKWLLNDILVGYTSILRLHFIVEYKAKSSNDYKIKYDNLSYETNILHGGGYHKNEGQKIGEMELWTFLTYNNLNIIKYLQGNNIRNYKIDSLKLSLLQSGIKPIILK